MHRVVVLVVGGLCVCVRDTGMETVRWTMGGRQHRAIIKPQAAEIFMLQ